MSDERVGQILLDTYRILRPLGRGGMGVVYEAEHLRLPKKVAVKVLKPDAAADPECFARFQREAKIASALGNSHICEVVDFGPADAPYPFIIMEHLDGCDLAAHLTREGRLPLAQCCRIAAEVLQGLDAAHARDIVHRDLKPSNIYLCRRDRRTDFVKLLDFGISKIRSSGTLLTSPLAVMGTPSYMAPEQTGGHGRVVDQRADVWGTGTVLYEMVTGRVAFTGPSVMSVLYQVAHEEPTPVNKLRRDAPPALCAIIERALSKDPDDRFPTARAMEDALREAAEATSVWSASDQQADNGSTEERVPDVVCALNVGVASTDPSGLSPTISDDAVPTLPLRGPTGPRPVVSAEGPTLAAGPSGRESSKPGAALIEARMALAATEPTPLLPPAPASPDELVSVDAPTPQWQRPPAVAAAGEPPTGPEADAASSGATPPTARHPADDQPLAAQQRPAAFGPALAPGVRRPRARWLLLAVTGLVVLGGVGVASVALRGPTNAKVERPAPTPVLATAPAVVPAAVPASAPAEPQGPASAPPSPQRDRASHVRAPDPTPATPAAAVGERRPATAAKTKRRAPQRDVPLAAKVLPARSKAVTVPVTPPPLAPKLARDPRDLVP
jgi:serine/threonine protein kinase